MIVKSHVTQGIETNDAGIDIGPGKRVIDEVVIRRIFIDVHTLNTTRFRLASFNKQPQSTSRKPQLIQPSIGAPHHTCSM